MKLVLVTCLVAVAFAAPKPQSDIPEAQVVRSDRSEVQVVRNDRPEVQILRNDRENPGDGNFNYAIEADNGINLQAAGSVGSEGQSNIQGSYWLPLEDGTFQEIRYVADEFGFRPDSSLLPTPHPDPPHVAELLRIAEEQRAQGITFE
ncbi:cuticle protein AMP2-like [Cherax quadricarinatus]|uniref:cuticle protein AMP2-like n=1 Tax=Cherax quadricarinatus TaxID=27406 RepID=UPI0023795629|nr:cuticle protein AMP2-like [Cherax quadricarinatus]